MHVSQLEINSPNNYHVTSFVGLKQKLVSMDINDSLCIPIMEHKHDVSLRTINRVTSELYIRHNIVYNTTYINNTFTITRVY